MVVLHKPKIRAGNQFCLSLFTPSWFPPSPWLSKPKLCWRAELPPEQQHKGQFSSCWLQLGFAGVLEDFILLSSSWASLILCQFCLVTTNNLCVRQQHDYSFISLILSAFVFQGATMQPFSISVWPEDRNCHLPTNTRFLGWCQSQWDISSADKPIVIITDQCFADVLARFCVQYCWLYTLAVMCCILWQQKDLSDQNGTWTAGGTQTPVILGMASSFYSGL